MGSPPHVSSLPLHAGPWPAPTSLPAHPGWGWDLLTKEGWTGRPLPQERDPEEGRQGARWGPHGARSQDPGRWQATSPCGQ